MRAPWDEPTRGCRNARVIQVIEADSFIGNGTPESPARIVHLYWGMDGALLAWFDGWKERQEDASQPASRADDVV